MPDQDALLAGCLTIGLLCAREEDGLRDFHDAHANLFAYLAEHRPDLAGALRAEYRDRLRALRALTQNATAAQ